MLSVGHTSETSLLLLLHAHLLLQDRLGLLLVMQKRLQLHDAFLHVPLLAGHLESHPFRFLAGVLFDGLLMLSHFEDHFFAGLQALVVHFLQARFRLGVLELRLFELVHGHLTLAKRRGDGLIQPCHLRRRSRGRASAVIQRVRALRQTASEVGAGRPLPPGVRVTR